ncbi:MAG: FHA domain-containing protein [Anaerolineales bacterium]|nr:FHA domain-containing protein [Anaerolineales bacterium]
MSATVHLKLPPERSLSFAMRLPNILTLINLGAAVLSKRAIGWCVGELKKVGAGMSGESKLALVPRSGRGMSYEVSNRDTPCLIGRDAEAKIRLNDQTVSRRHAKLIYDRGQWILCDQSQNGTYVNGALIKGSCVSLKRGDTVRVGASLDHTVVIVNRSTDETTITKEVQTTVVTYPEDQLRVVNAGEVWVGQQRLRLSDQEVKLVQLLEAAAGKRCSDEEIIKHIFDGIGDIGNVQELVKRVREKIRKQTGQDGRKYIERCHDGYVLYVRPRR